MEYSYSLIDAFTHTAYQGAQVAVFTEAGGLSTQQMQLMARELNLSETVFAMPADDAKAAIRIQVFSPEAEQDVMGHPVIAAAYALVLEGKLKSGASSLEHAAGFIDVHVAMKESAIEDIQFVISSTTGMDDFVPSAHELAEIIGLDENELDMSRSKPSIAVCGNRHLIIPVKSFDVLHRARFNINKWTMSFVATLATNIVLLCKSQSRDDSDYCARLIGKGIGESSDPPIGPVAPALGVYLFHDVMDGQHNVIIQRGGGEKRKSLLHLEVAKSNSVIESIKLGGAAVKVGTGSIIAP